MKAQHGLTLIELMVATLVLAIVSGIAVSSLSHGLESARSAAVRGDLLSSLALATGRAILAGNRTVICPSADSLACSDDPDWSRGWLVFQDSNASRELEGGEVVLRRHEALPGRVRLRSTTGRVRIVFQGSGGNGGSNVTFTLCDGRGPEQARALILSNNGRLREGAATAANLAATCVH
jgi:type IV fimbrial biogenesis protein FimT